MRDTEFASSKLSIAQRIQLAEDLWDSIPPKKADIALTEAQRAALDLERDPDAGEPPEAVRARLSEPDALIGVALEDDSVITDVEIRRRWLQATFTGRRASNFRIQASAGALCVAADGRLACARRA